VDDECVPGFAVIIGTDIAYFGGRYNLYYAASDWGRSIRHRPRHFAFADFARLDGSGKVIQSNPDFATNATTDLTAYNCIDPSVMVTQWHGVAVLRSYSTAFSSCSWIRPPQTHLANSRSTGCQQRPGIFSNSEEGSCLYQHGGYYYLFVTSAAAAPA